MNVATVDYIARISAAWDGRGPQALTPPTEHAVLLKLAGLDESLSMTRWHGLTGEQRRRIVAATRRVLELAELVGWFYGAVKLKWSADECH